MPERLSGMLMRFQGLCRRHSSGTGYEMCWAWNGRCPHATDEPGRMLKADGKRPLRQIAPGSSLELVVISHPPLQQLSRCLLHR